MGSRHAEKRMNAECRDRLSNLPDDIIHNIFSFLEITQAIETSELSSRWRYMWTSMPSLSFSNEKFHSLPKFSKFVTNVLSRRNDQIEVSSVNLTFSEKISKMIVSRISKYMLSHNVQQLKIIYWPKSNKIKSELPVIISQSLQNLTLNGGSYDESFLITTPHTWELPALTILNLHGVTLQYGNSDKCAGLFSNCANLRNLTLRECEMTGLDDFNICHPGLSSLTLENCLSNAKVVAPQLKNLIIKYSGGIHLISVPKLSSFSYKGTTFLVDLWDDLLHFEKVEICLSSPKTNVDKVVSLLQQIHSVKFLTLSSEIIEALSYSSFKLISHQPSPFTNLKSLKIYPEYVTKEEHQQPKVYMSTEVIEYLLDGSSGANLTMVSHEEIRVVRNVVSAQKLMRELQVELDRLKEYSEIDTTDLYQVKAPIKSHMAAVHKQADQVENGTTQPDTKVKGYFGERVARVKSYLEDTNRQWEKGYEKSGCILSKLQEIKEVLTKLPASHLAKLQAKFSGLSAEAGTVLDNMMDNLKSQCDKAPRFKCLLS